MSDSVHTTTGMSKHRVDALTDGIFAVAMTLLVIELKIPEAATIRDNAGLVQAYVHLIPKFIAWLISFFVLALFWYGHHRAFHFVHRVDGKLVALNTLLLGWASFMPFASAVTGDYTGLAAGQVVYSGTMFMVAVSALLIWRYIYRHPELCQPAMGTGTYRAARFRTQMLMAISVIAVVITLYLPGAGNVAFMLMMVVGPVSRRIEAKYAPAPDPTLSHPA